MDRPSPPQEGKGNLFKTILFMVVGGLIFYYLGRQIWQNWRDIFPRLQNFSVPWGLGAVLCAVFHFAFCVLIWELTMNKVFVEDLPLAKGFRIWTISQLGRYLPGKVWAVAGRMELCRKEQIPRRTTAMSIYVEMVLVTAAAALLFTAGLFLWPVKLPPHLSYILTGASALFLAGVHPRVLKALLRVIAGREKHSLSGLNLGYGALLQLMGMGVFNWLLGGGAIFCAIRAVYMVEFKYIIILGGMLGVAWLMGVVSLFAPSGIGVREGALTYLLSFHLPLHMASLASLLARLVFILAELVFLALVLAIVGKEGLRRSGGS